MRCFVFKNGFIVDWFSRRSAPAQIFLQDAPAHSARPPGRVFDILIGLSHRTAQQ